MDQLSMVNKKGTRGWGWFHKELKNRNIPVAKPKSIPKPPENFKRNIVFMELESGKDVKGRIEIELFNDIVPNTCQNFINLCTKTPGYKSSKFHYVKRQFAICGGDYIDGSGNNNKSSFENKDLFEDENFKIQFTEPYLLGMLNNGVDENGSQFFISLVPLPHLSIFNHLCMYLDGRNVGFGRIKNGKKVINEIGSIYTSHMKPIEEITIKDCGLL